MFFAFVIDGAEKRRFVEGGVIADNREEINLFLREVHWVFSLREEGGWADNPV